MGDSVQRGDRITSYLDEDGAALITVLFIAALAAIITVSLVVRQQIDIRRTENVIHSDQATLYAEGAADWGAIVLTRDLIDGPVDSLGEEWAVGLQPTALNAGRISATIADMQGRFNINNIVAANKDYRHFSQDQFTRMLEMCALSTDLLNATIDWLDSDQEITFPGGAEDETYMVLGTPYRTADTLMVSPSELRLVAGFDQEGYNCLAPYISALPNETYLNVNTASAFVLAAASRNFSLMDAEDLLANRPLDGLNSVSSFFLEPTITATKFFNPFLTVSSDFFLATIHAEIGNGKVTMYTLFQRQKNQTSVIQKSFGVY